MTRNDSRRPVSPITVTAVIPTACEPHRWDLLNRAIRSLLTQAGVTVNVVVVTNGTRFDIAKLTELYRREDITVVYTGDSGVAGAQRKGRELVTGAFFCFLDDDDEYLPGAMAARLEALLNDENLAMTATNGLRQAEGLESAVYSSAEASAASRDPYTTLATRNWLTSCGGMYRSASVGLEFFDGVSGHQEWTLLAYRLIAAGRKLKFLDVPTYRLNDTPASLSKAASHQGQEVLVLKKVLELGLPEDVHRSVRVKLGRALHAQADHALSSGNWLGAVLAHARSLVAPNGWRYFPSSRRFLLPNFGRRKHP